MSSSDRASKLGSHDIRSTDASAYIESQSIRRIQTRLRSSDHLQTTVRFYEKKRFSGEVSGWKEVVCGIEPFALELDEDSLGSEFTFQVEQKDLKTQVFTDYFQFVVRAELTVEETRGFLQNAVNIIDSDSMRPARFYKVNKIAEEERLIEQNSGCYEHKRIGNRCHRASPLCGKINGTSFNCLLMEEKDASMRQDEGLPQGYIYPKTSAHGFNRRSFDCEKILNAHTCLFLADLHCYLNSKDKEWKSRTHYPLLIVCQEKSATYHECNSLGLIKLEWKTNIFLRWNRNTGELKCATKLLKLSNQRFAHDVFPEILVCDTAVSIEEGLQSECEMEWKNEDSKSFFGCKACHGYLQES